MNPEGLEARKNKGRKEMSILDKALERIAEKGLKVVEKVVDKVDILVDSIEVDTKTDSDAKENEEDITIIRESEVKMRTHKTTCPHCKKEMYIHFKKRE